MCKHHSESNSQLALAWHAESLGCHPEHSMPGMLVSAPWEDQELIVIIIINIVGHGDLSASWGLEVLSQKDKKKLYGFVLLVSILLAHVGDRFRQGLF